MPNSRTHYLLAILAIVLLSSTYYYLRVEYPGLFYDFRSKLETLIPISQHAATDSTDTNNSDISTSPIPLPTQSPFPLIPDEGTAGNYTVTHGTPTGPKITKIRLDPLSAKVGDEIKVLVSFNHNSQITGLECKITTDQKEINFTLTENPQDKTQWQGSFRLTQPIDYTYIYHFSATDILGNNSELNMALRTK